MAPTITSAMTISNEHLPLNNKLMKAMVEKMHRDCINSSIEHLKSLLALEFLNQKPDTKLGKTDILKITVSLLRQLQHQQRSAFPFSSAALNQGFSRCVHDLVYFLSKEELKTQSQSKLRESALPQLSSTEQQIISKEKRSVKSSLWRPW